MLASTKIIVIFSLTNHSKAQYMNIYEHQTMKSDELIESDKLNIAGIFLLLVLLPLNNK